MRLAVVAILFLAAPLAAQGRAAETLRREYESKLRTLKIEAGQRHLVLGVECRDKGLTTQAAEEFVLAVEVSEGLNPGANTVLSLMRRYDDAFWKKRAPKPTPAKIDAYARDAAKVREKNLADRLELLTWAFKRGFESEAYEDLVSLLRVRDEPLEFDAAGLLVLGSKKMPAALSARVLAESIEINSRRYVRDEFLMRVPSIERLFEATDEHLRVRSTSDLAQAAALHALGSALLPVLEADLGARPARRLAMVVVPDRATYEAYLDAAGLGAHKVVTGVADSGSLTAVICGEGVDEQLLHGIVLHELAHLFHFGVSRSVMPSWYSEGFADTYGGPGTFQWKDGKLTTGGALDRSSFAGLREGTLPYTVGEMLGADGLSLWSSDRARGLAFYAQSWAWIRFLRNGAGEDVAERFARWEADCRGGALGAEIGKPRGGQRSDADACFQKLFGGDLARLEREFVAWASDL